MTKSFGIMRTIFTVEGSLDRSLGAYDAAAFEPSAVMGSALRN